MYFRYFVIMPPWKRACPFIWTNLNPLHPKNVLCQISLKLEQWFWGRRFLYFVNVFSLFRNYPPLDKGVFLHLNIPFTQGCLVPSLVEIGLLVLEKMKMWKFIDRQTDNRQSEKLTWAFSSGKLKIEKFLIKKSTIHVDKLLIKNHCIMLLWGAFCAPPPFFKIQWLS